MQARELRQKEAILECKTILEVKQEWIEGEPEGYEVSPYSIGEERLFHQNWFPVLGSDDLEYLFVLGGSEYQQSSPLFHCHLGGGDTPNKASYRSLTHFFQVKAECFETGAYFIEAERDRYGRVRLGRDERKVALINQKYSASDLDRCLNLLQQQPITFEVVAEIDSEIAKYRDPRTVKPLIRLLNVSHSEVTNPEENLAVRFRAASLLGDVGGLEAIDALIEVIENHLTHSDDWTTMGNWTVVGYAAEALGKLGDPRAVAPIRRLIESCHVNDPTEALNKIASQHQEDMTASNTAQFYSQVFDAIHNALPTNTAWEEHFALEQATLALASLERRLPSY